MSGVLLVLNGLLSCEFLGVGRQGRQTLLDLFDCHLLDVDMHFLGGVSASEKNRECYENFFY